MFWPLYFLLLAIGLIPSIPLSPLCALKCCCASKHVAISSIWTERDCTSVCASLIQSAHGAEEMF